MNKYTEEDFKAKCAELSLHYIGFHPEKHKGRTIEFICPKHENKGVQCSPWSHFTRRGLYC